MSRPFGSTSHAEIVHAFEAENRTHTPVEETPTGPARRYVIHLTAEELLTLLDALTARGVYENVLAHSGSSDARLHARQLRVRLLQTLGLTEEG